jgi:hypothetical protein
MTSSTLVQNLPDQLTKGKPLMVVSATISSAPTMVYFGQEVGEAGNGAGFGTHSNFFDYVGVPNHQRWDE